MQIKLEKDVGGQRKNYKNNLQFDFNLGVKEGRH